MSGKRLTSERLRDKTGYGLYCVNIHGSGLNTIKDEFKRQVHTGLRQTLFILDLDELQKELNNQPRNSKMRKELKENFNNYLINNIIQQIQGFRKEYELQTKKINDELKFDLYEYWLQKTEKNNKISLDPKLKESSNKTKDAKTIKEFKEGEKIACPTYVIPQEHNRLGQSQLISKRKYIKDEPTMGKLYIIILGQMYEEFFKDLLRRDQPLEGIINFIPTESNYDIMLGNNKLRNYIAETLETINFSIYQMRQEISLKPVGLFNHNLPVISECLAIKHSREIYDQLTWSIYDIEVLRQQYQLYYYKPFQLTDVAIPASVNLVELYHKAESLSIKGHFQNSNLPISGSDLATTAAYLSSLLNTCAWPESVETNSNFFSIIKIPKFERLIMADNNKFLLNMLQYANTNKFNSLYLTSLDYKMFKQYSVIATPKLGCDSNEVNLKTINLPKYVKYYPNEDCSQQRLTELFKQYDDYEIQEIATGYKLYTFRRSYNVLNEAEDRVVIPTRLCFRDFTLYQMEEFLQNLNTPKPKTNLSPDASLQEKKVKTLEFNDSIFIRPNSLKALKLQKDITKEENKNRKSDHSTRSKNDKKSSLAKSSIKGESMGLPEDHHLLKGYNLEDTLQEVKYKISKYYYHQGLVQLYEEKWCFQDMNKQLTLAINNTTIFFNRPRNFYQNLSNNIRLVTPNDISLRILNDTEECSKIVMNYPNGLSIFYHDTYCEQISYCDQSPREEDRRIYTNLGAIIVFFKSNDLIMVMRYNGEVYKLYQHELKEEEEQEQGFTSDLGEIQEKSSGYIDLKAQGDSRLVQGQRDKIKHNFSQSKKSCINYELNFLSLLCSTYGLKYLHLIITTSQGRRLNMTHQGEIFEGPQCSIKEWHDYFTNESYCERSDGVKMIWSSDCLKCFHKDGTLLKTTIEEVIENEITDEFESQITQSSSHDFLREEMEEEKPDKSEKHLKENRLSYGILPSTFISQEGAEEHIADIPFTIYYCNSYFMHHPNYADVYTLNPELPNFNSLMEIFGIDDIRIYIHRELFYKENYNIYDSLRSEDEEFTIDNSYMKSIVNVWIGENLHVSADNESCEVYAVMSESQVDKGLKSDISLSLRLKYTDCINDAFKYLVNEISLLEGNNMENTENLYYIEKQNLDCSRRGFEFYASPPVLSHYNCRVSNNITELKTVNSIQELMTHNCQDSQKDVNKFPRFKQVHKKRPSDLTNEFPQVLSANIFIEIPQQLRSTDHINKFLEPFENLNFKKLRGKFKNVLNCYLKPQQQEDLKIFNSTMNWKKRHLEHKRRLFREQQRLGLYHAMIKHKIYPNYWKFSNNYADEVHRIEFFDFMQNKCEKRGVQENEGDFK